jgi:hypothetical protein
MVVYGGISFYDGEKCYLACFSNGFVPASAEIILKDSGSMEKNNRVCMIYLLVGFYS